LESFSKILEILQKHLLYYIINFSNWSVNSFYVSSFKYKSLGPPKNSIFFINDIEPR
jgi:hypothetical protein